jgi:hypothetical protein
MYVPRDLLQRKIWMCCHCPDTHVTYIKQTPWPLVRKRTTPADRPPLVGEVIGNFCTYMGVGWSAQRVLTAVEVGFLDGSPFHTHYL